MEARTGKRSHPQAGRRSFALVPAIDERLTREPVMTGRMSSTSITLRTAAFAAEALAAFERVKQLEASSLKSEIDVLSRPQDR